MNEHFSGVQLATRRLRDGRHWGFGIRHAIPHAHAMCGVRPLAMATGSGRRGVARAATSPCWLMALCRGTRLPGLRTAQDLLSSNVESMRHRTVGRTDTSPCWLQQQEKYDES